MDYWHYAYRCPYMQSTEPNKIHCERGSRITFPVKEQCKEHLLKYCSCNSWVNCQIAHMLEEYYEFWEEKTDTERTGREDI